MNDVEGLVHLDRESYDEASLSKDLNQLKNKGIVKLPDLQRGHECSVSFPIKAGDDGPLKHLPEGQGVGFPGSSIMRRGRAWLTSALKLTARRFLKEKGKKNRFGEQAYLNPETHEPSFNDDAFGNMQKWFTKLVDIYICLCEIDGDETWKHRKREVRRTTSILLLPES